ncbi:MAG: hypothetical protein GX038_02095 [Erysipelothrix sp.]|nr:hypothetical protein [Erysipelothrix sp.]
MIDYGEDFNIPDYIKVDREEYEKDQEKIEYYNTAINLIKDNLKEYLLNNSTIDETITDIGIIIKELEDEIN